MVRRTITRLARTSSAELRFRLAERAHVLAEAATLATGRARWRPPVFRISPSPSKDVREAAAASRNGDRRAAGAALAGHLLRRESRFPLDPAQRTGIVAGIHQRFPSAAAHAAARARRIVAGRYDLLGYEELAFAPVASPPDWHLDPMSGRRAPMRFWSRVPYLDPAVGDHKVIWELNRHQHWLALGRAAWLAPSPEYGGRFRAELVSWFEQNPPYQGVNWASMLELGFRSISWLWALHFFVDPGDDDPSWIVDLLGGLQAQLDHVSRHLSRYFSPNTHLLGEGLALYVAGSVLPELAGAERWERIGREILLRETRAQVRPDGGHAEQSLHYHRYALDFYLLALVIARKTGDQAATTFEQVSLRMARFCRAMADDSGRLPTIGDDDGGALFPICGRAPFDAAPSLSLAATLLAEPTLATGPVDEEVIWMTGGTGEADRQLEHPQPSSVLFPDTGYASMRSANTHAIVDAGPHGFLNGGHAHADALSVTLSIGGRPFLIDPGTATYVMDPAARHRFRSTAMHNTAVVGGRSQSVAAGPFHWRTRTNGRILKWKTSTEIDFLEAEHTGYLPIVHRRTVVRIRDLWIVADHVLGPGSERVETHWHIDPAWTIEQRAGEAAYDATAGVDRIVIRSTAPESTLFVGDAGGLGWCAPVYGKVVPAPTLRFAPVGALPVSIVTAIAAAASGDLLLEPLPVQPAGNGDGPSAFAVLVTYSSQHYLAMFDMRDVRMVRNRATVGTVEVGRSTFSTDARGAVLHLSAGHEPLALDLVDGSRAEWTGPAGFVLRRPMAEDLHQDSTVLRQLSRSKP
jgi:hypothetical protein